MPTRVPDARERVHLGVDAEGAPAVAAREFGDPGGLKEVVSGDLEALLLDEGR